MRYSSDTISKFTVVSISGNIDTAESTKQLDDEISTLCRKGHHHFLFNLERTTYLDSAGISILIHCLCDVNEHNGSIFIVAEDNQVRRVLEMVGINRLITTYGSLREFRNANELPAG